MTRRRVVTTTAVLALTLLLAGCSGDEQAGAFQRAFAADPAVESLELTSHDNQPFTGGVSGEVFLRDRLADAEIEAVADRVGSYTRDHGEEMRGRVSLVADGFQVVITGDEAKDAATVGTLLDLRADDRVRSAEIGSSFVDIVGADAGGTIALVREAAELAGAALPDAGSTLVVRTDDDAINVRGTASQREAALAVWDALEVDIPLSGLRLREDDLVVDLRRESDHPRAQERATATPLAADVTVRFASDLVRLGESDGSRARELLSTLDAAVLSQIAFVWESGTRLQIDVRPADVTAVIEPLTDALPAGTTEASVAVEGAEDSRVQLRVGADG